MKGDLPLNTEIQSLPIYQSHSTFGAGFPAPILKLVKEKRKDKSDEKSEPKSN